VELMRDGMNPSAAAAAAVRRIARVYPSSSAAVLALNVTGDYGNSAMSSHLHRIKHIITAARLRWTLRH